jgi:beta-lactamase superfamily II metal-dependent hydrolase
MIFSLDVRRARKGDCLIVHYGTKNDPGLILIDGGPSQVYRPHLKPRLAQICKARKLAADQSLPVDLLMVSHIDDDHINGILELTKELANAADEKRPLPLKIRSFWHNSFDDIVGNNPKELLASVTASFGAAGMSGELDSEGFDADTARVLASAAQGFRLRDDARKLKLPINKEFGGKLVMAEGERSVDFGKGLQFTVVGPMKAELLALQKEHDAFLRRAKGKAAKAALAAFTDNSVANLSSIVVLAEANGKRMLLTGDARGDKILEGLEKVKLLKPRNKMHVDILKVPHHGSSRNMEGIFFERIIADHYVFSGNGEHGNPDRETLQMLSDARGDANFNVYLTYPINEIDVARKADWEEEQAKEKARKTRNPNVKVRKNWSPKENSLVRFLAANQEFARKVTIVTGENPFVINLHEKLNY